MLGAARHSQSRWAGARHRTTPDHASLRSATWWRPVPVAGQRAIGQLADGGVADAAAKGYQRPWAGFGKAHLVDQLADQPQPTPAKAGHCSRAWRGGRPRSRMVASIQPPPTLTVAVTGCASPDPY